MSTKKMTPEEEADAIRSVLPAFIMLSDEAVSFLNSYRLSLGIRTFVQDTRDMLAAIKEVQSATNSDPKTPSATAALTVLCEGKVLGPENTTARLASSLIKDSGQELAAKVEEMKRHGFGGTRR